MYIYICAYTTDETLHGERVLCTPVCEIKTKIFVKRIHETRLRGWFLCAYNIITGAACDLLFL